MAEKTKSLIFIPDITGFTNFVNQTEIQHSQHIISELLETIIDSNEIDMEVSEVEGDAVLFYKTESPDINEVLGQVRKTFLEFHKQIRAFESKRICHCGACTETINLSLKFVIHQGDIGFTQVKETKKPFGADLILVHRLLKNDVNTKEYVLVTQSYDINENSLSDWAEFKPGHSTYDQFGEVNYLYASLSNLHQYVENPPPIELPAKAAKPISRSVHINLPIEVTYEKLTNFSNRLDWVEGLEGFLYEENRVNKVGVQHRCVVGNNQFFDFETVTNDFGEAKNERMVYGERLLKFPLMKEAIQYYILDVEGEGTKLTGEFHLIPVPVIGHIVKFFLQKKLIKGFNENLDKFKAYCEKDALIAV